MVQTILRSGNKTLEVVFKRAFALTVEIHRDRSRQRLLRNGMASAKLPGKRQRPHEHALDKTIAKAEGLLRASARRPSRI